MGHLLCPLLTPTVCSGTITGLSVPCRPWPAGTHRRSPGVSSCTFGAQPLDLRLWPLMDMDFVLSCALVRPQRLLSSFCSSARTWATRFFQTSPHGDALAFRSPSPPSGWQRDLHPPSAGTGPAHMKPPRSLLRGIPFLNPNPQNSSIWISYCGSFLYIVSLPCFLTYWRMTASWP